MANITSPKWDARFSSPISHIPHPVPHTNEFYGKCMLGGILACGLTHMAVTPLDVSKCKMQVYPNKYQGLMSTMKTIVKEEGVRGLGLGWVPTLIGYSAQGMLKFGLYEVFKDLYATSVFGEDFFSKYQGLVWASASASAEFFADIALCPLEMTKVKVQTSPQGTFPKHFFPALKEMNAKKVDTKFPFGSISPLWGRQIPYTVAKFYCFEKTVQMIYTHVLTKPKNEYSKPTQLSVTFASGYLAGIVCAVVSQPADNLVSQLSNPANKEKSFGTIVSENGFKKLVTAGLGPRILMVGTLTGLQWWIYDSFKTFMGMGTTGGAAIKK